jgi:hypothetical protein
MRHYNAYDDVNKAITKKKRRETAAQIKFQCIFLSFVFHSPVTGLVLAKAREQRALEIA